MATKHLSMAEELLNAVTEPFTKVLCLLHDSRTITIDNFKRQHAKLMKHHWIDSSILQTRNKQHPTTTGIFELYRKKTCLNASELKELLIDWICDKRTELTNCMAIALNQSKQSFMEWLQSITLKDDFIPDELTIYCLSHFLNVHTLVYTLNFCWSTLMNQFKYNNDELYEKSNIRLVYIGHHMFAKLKHIRQPQTSPSVPNVSPGTDKSKSSSGRCNKKVINRGDKPRHGRKATLPLPPLPTPPASRSSRRSRQSIDYLQPNDGLEEPAVTSPKTKKKKMYPPPPRTGPSARRQAANKKNKLSLKSTPDTDKLPDLVLNQEQQEEFNAVTTQEMTTIPETENASSNEEFKGVTNHPHSSLVTIVTPENEEL